MGTIKDMKFLVFDQGQFVWRTQSKDSSRLSRLYLDNIYYDEAGYSYNQSVVYATENDFRKKYYLCSGCKQLVSYRSEKSHKAKAEKLVGHCDKCPKVTYQESNVISSTVKIIDGKYIKTKKIELKPLCSNGYKSAPSEMIRWGSCMYQGCNEKIKDLRKEDWVANSNLLSKVATVDALNNHKKWEFVSRTSNDLFEYRYGKTNLKAYANAYGMIVYFRYTNRSTTVAFVYSATSDKFYSYNGICSAINLWQLPESRKAKMVEAMKDLYK